MQEICQMTTVLFTPVVSIRAVYAATNTKTSMHTSGIVAVGKSFDLAQHVRQSDLGVKCHCTVNLGSYARYLIHDSIIWFRNYLCRLVLCVRIMSTPGRPRVRTEAFDL